jgi:hypothetical protein
MLARQGFLPHEPTFVMFCFLFLFFPEIGSHELFAQGWHETDPSDLCLLISQDYKCEPSVPTYFRYFKNCMYEYLPWPDLVNAR